jgi:beta-galactosidase
LGRWGRLVASWVGVISLGGAPLVGATAVISEVLPFAGADNVRIEVRVRADDAVRGLALSGRIEPWEGGPVLWAGDLGTADLAAGGQATVTRHITGLSPQRWDLDRPQLYRLTVSARNGAERVERSTRLGFRAFESRAGQFWLNGRPIYLRGNAINPPGRGVPAAVGQDRAFAEAYLRDLKRRHVNLVRVDSDLWQDVCDEIGLLVFHGRYGAPRGATKTAPPVDVPAAIARYQSEYFEGYLKHPSVVISILSNEMPRRGAEGEAYGKFFDEVHAVLRQWDPNRLYIGNAGFGGGRGGEINDAHPYWGWYGGDFLSNYSRLLDRGSGRPAEQPWTFSECVGAYTTPEGRFSVAGKLLGTSLTWTGHCAEQAEKALRYQAFLAQQFIEIQRRLRPANPNLAGIMPFTPIWFNWEGIGRFEDMKPKPVADQLAVSFQPVLLSWELWTPQVYAGATVEAVAHIVNDADDGRGLRGARLGWRLVGANGRAESSGEMALPEVPYYGTRTVPVALRVPGGLSGSYTLVGEIVVGEQVRSRNSCRLTVRDAERPRAGGAGGVRLYDPSGRTVEALRRLGFGCQVMSERFELPDVGTPLVIGEMAWDDRLTLHAARLQAFVRAGGRVLVLRPDAPRFDAAWLGAKVQASPRNGMWINLERPAHPAFAGLTHWDFEWWSDYTGWRQGREELPRIHPAAVRYTLGDAADLARVAVLANYDVGLRSIALCEVFDGMGSVILSGFDLVERAGRDPVADQLLANLVRLATSKAGHEVYPLIERALVWGDYATEQGTVVSSQQGLLVNQDRDRPRGRRLLGPFQYGGPTNGYVIDPKPAANEGWGRIFVRVPAGRQVLLTRVENPEKADLPLAVTLNGVTTQHLVSGGATTVVRTPLPVATDLDLRYAGDKRLVLLATEFK